MTDKKKNAILKDIDEKLTRTAKELGYSLEQKTMKMKQRDKKVWLSWSTGEHQVLLNFFHLLALLFNSFSPSSQ